MRDRRSNARFLARLESRIDAVVRGEPRAVLAFSAGLGSIVVAAIARKRLDLTCSVVGIGRAPDRVAADRCASFMDYPIRRIQLRPEEAVRIGREIVRRTPRLDAAEVWSLVPTAAVREQNPTALVLGGHGTARISRAVSESLTAYGVKTPLRASQTSTLPARSTLSACATLLGLPPAFGRPARRPAASGSGVADAVLRVAASQGIRTSDLLQSRHYHEGTRARADR